MQLWLLLQHQSAVKVVVVMAQSKSLKKAHPASIQL
jgi:hypothetical protein